MCRHICTSSDAIALNIGGDDWQQTQIASAYSAAQKLGTNFKLFISFDFTAMGCDLNTIVSQVNQFANHPNQFLVNGKTMISSYSGDCLGDSGWASLKAQTNGYVMPFIWGLEGSFSSWPSLDSWYWWVSSELLDWQRTLNPIFSSWGCAWPHGDYPKNVCSIRQYFVNGH
jgi:glucan endo-1,3-alpha-glucosidase